jgi:hypothetical protein
MNIENATVPVTGTHYESSLTFIRGLPYSEDMAAYSLGPDNQRFT